MITVTIIICITILLALIIWVLHKRICIHQWNMTEKIKVYDDYDNDDPNCIPAYSKYVMQCTKCGKIKHYVAK